MYCKLNYISISIGICGLNTVADKLVIRISVNLLISASLRTYKVKHTVTVYMYPTLQLIKAKALPVKFQG